MRAPRGPKRNPASGVLLNQRGFGPIARAVRCTRIPTHITPPLVARGTSHNPAYHTWVGISLPAAQDQPAVPRTESYDFSRGEVSRLWAFSSNKCELPQYRVKGHSPRLHSKANIGEAAFWPNSNSCRLQRNQDRCFDVYVNSAFWK